MKLTFYRRWLKVIKINTENVQHIVVKAKEKSNSGKGDKIDVLEVMQ